MLHIVLWPSHWHFGSTISSSRRARLVQRTLPRLLLLLQPFLLRRLPLHLLLMLLSLRPLLLLPFFLFPFRLIHLALRSRAHPCPASRNRRLDHIGADARQGRASLRGRRRRRVPPPALTRSLRREHCPLGRMVPYRRPGSQESFLKVLFALAAGATCSVAIASNCSYRVQAVPRARLHGVSD